MTEDANGNEPDKEGLPDFIHSIKQQKLSSHHWKREELQRHGLTKHRHHSDKAGKDAQPGTADTKSLVWDVKNQVVPKVW